MVLFGPGYKCGTDRTLRSVLNRTKAPDSKKGRTKAVYLYENIVAVCWRDLTGHGPLAYLNHGPNRLDRSEGVEAVASKYSVKHGYYSRQLYGARS